MFGKLFQIKDKNYLDTISTAGTIGLHMVSCTFVGMAMGYYLDKWLDTHPVFLFLFLFFGIVAGFKHIYLEAKRIQRRQSAPDGGGTNKYETTPHDKGDIRANGEGSEFRENGEATDNVDKTQ